MFKQPLLVSFSLKCVISQKKSTKRGTRDKHLTIENDVNQRIRAVKITIVTAVRSFLGNILTMVHEPNF
jgi:hypothetical protein